MSVKSNNVQIFITKNKTILIIYAITIIIFTIFSTLQKDFLTPYGLTSIFNQVIVLCIIVFGQTLVIISAGIDLSVGAIVGLTNSLAATVMFPLYQYVGNEFYCIIITIIIALLVGSFAGLINGVIITYVRLQPIIVTLATSSVILGIALYIRPSPGGKVLPIFTNLFTGRLLNYIPISFIILLVFIFIWILFRHLRLSQSIYAIGSSEFSSYTSGINVSRTKILVYVLSGLFSACGGLVLTSQTASGDPVGSGLFTLNSIAAVVLGGAALTGGKGSYLGSVAGAITLSLILGILVFLGISSFLSSAVQGIILILVLSTGLIKSKKREYLL